MAKKKKQVRETARVSLPTDLFERLKLQSETQMISMSAIIRQAVKNHLTKIK